MRCRAELRHIPDASGLVVHVRQQQEGCTIEQRCGVFAIRCVANLNLGAQALQPLQDVEVGRKVLTLGHDHRTSRPEPECCCDNAEERDRRRFTNHHLACTSPKEWRDAITDAQRQGVPVGLVPAANETLAPLRADHAVDPRRNAQRQCAERIPVEVDDAFWNRERAADCCKRITGVEFRRATHRGTSSALAARLATVFVRSCMLVSSHGEAEEA